MLRIELYVCAPFVYLVPMETKRKLQISYNWSYRRLWAFLWMLGTKSVSSARASSACNSGAISPSSDPSADFVVVLEVEPRASHMLNNALTRLRSQPWSHFFSWLVTFICLFVDCVFVTYVHEYRHSCTMAHTRRPEGFLTRGSRNRHLCL